LSHIMASINQLGICGILGYEEFLEVLLKMWRIFLERVYDFVRLDFMILV